MSKHEEVLSEATLSPEEAKTMQYFPLPSYTVRFIGVEDVLVSAYKVTDGKDDDRIAVNVGGKNLDNLSVTMSDDDNGDPFITIKKM